MWKIPKYLVQRGPRRLNHEDLFVAAATVMGGVMWVLGQQNRNDKMAMENDNCSPRAFRNVDSLIKNSNLLSTLFRFASTAAPVVPTAMAQCEPLGFRVAHLRRHRTIQKLERTAEKVTIDSRYQVDWKQPLGEGTFGKVYQGVDRRTKEKVAVKKISKAFTDNVAFTREMDALLHLRQHHGHPNICGLRENFDEDEFYYLVLDLITGGEMFDALCANGAYSELDAARLVREVANALHFMHGIGIVHGAYVCAYQFTEEYCIS